MTKLFYSASLNAFLSEATFGANIPAADAVEVDPEAAQAMRAEYEAAGGSLVIAPGDDGLPELRPASVESRADLVARALVKMRAERAPILTVLDGLQASASAKAFAAFLAGDMATRDAQMLLAQQIEAAKQGLKDAGNLDLSACVTYEDMRQAFKTYYGSLVAVAPMEVKLAFKQAA